MQKYPFIILLLIILPCNLLLAQPFQFIKYESATLVRNGKSELKLNGIHEIGQIPTNAALLQFRYCLFKNIEISAKTIFVQFTETNQNQLASISVASKARLKFMDFGGFQFVNYIKYRIALGHRYVDVYTGKYDEVLSVVSPYADEGKDLMIGLLGRKAVTKNIELTLGCEYMYADGRNYFNFTDDQKNVASLFATPQKHVFNKKVLLVVENKFTYWINRGTLYETIPEIRWEAFPGFVFEGGINLPLYGGKNTQYTFGFTYEFNK